MPAMGECARLSISLQGPSTASPFPSPSSSFLTPPTPGAHEFALKPLRNPIPDPQPPSSPRDRPPSLSSPFDPSLCSSRPAPPSPAGGSTPSLSRRQSSRSKPASMPVSRANSLRHRRGSSHASSPGGHGLHRVSAGNHSRTFSSSSLASPTKPTFDMGVSSSSPVIQDTSIPSEPSSLSFSTTSTSVSTTDTQLQPSSQPDEQTVFIKIRDFAFQPADERHNGQGPLVPKPNRVGRMNRRLGGRSYSSSSISSSDGDGFKDDDDDDDDDPDGWGWNAGGYGSNGFGYGGGWVGGRFSWAVSSSSGAATAATIFDQEKVYAAAAANLSAAASKANGNASNEDGYPSRSEMDRNFLDSESEEFFDAEDVYDEEMAFGDTSSGVGDEDEPLYPGLYRALYPFEPEGTAEMRLVEDQIVRVVGRGGGVGWAVVVAESREESDILDSKATKHALVPESYLEPFKLDWELDEDDAVTSQRTA